MSHELVERALALSKADGCIVIAEQSSTANLRWANSTLTTNGATRDRSLIVISVIGRSVGTQSVSSVGEAEVNVEALVRASEAAAHHADDAEDFSDLCTGGVDSDYEAPADRTSTGVFDRFATELAHTFTRSDMNDRRAYGFADYDVTTTWLGLSTGLRRRHTQRTGTAELTARNPNTGTSAYLGQATADFTDVNVLAADDELSQRLRWAANRKVELPAGRYETLLPPTATADLVGNLYFESAGRDAAEGRSAFSRSGGGTRIGERLAPNGVRLYSDPNEPGMCAPTFALAASSSSISSIFDNGVDLPRAEWIVDGHLRHLMQTRATARQTKSAFTPYVHNLVLDGGPAATATLDEMIARTERGLLLTCVWYIREVDPQSLLLTGLTRDGVYLVENGEVTAAVNNFRFNESPLDLLGRTTEIGASVPAMPREWSDWFSLTRMPVLRIPDFNMSSVSQAT